MLASAPSQLKPHPFADLLPLLQGDAFEHLAADIKAHGLQVPIVLFDGLVLDGRNRLRACLREGVAPRFEVFQGSNDAALAYVLSLNVTRRHLSTVQRSVLALKLLPLEEGKAAQRMKAGVRTHPAQNAAEGPRPPKGEAMALAGRRVGVSKESVRQAKRISKHAPDVLQAMSIGLLRSMAEAQRLAQTPASLIQHLQKHGGRVSKALLAIKKQKNAPNQDPPRQPQRITTTKGARLIYGAHVIDALRELPEQSIHCVITSPPYWGGLRDYGTPAVVWGGDRDCAHEWIQSKGESSRCALCGAWRGQLGHEPTVQLYLDHIVAVFNELRRVLRPEGTAWLILGDSYVTPASAHAQLKAKDLALVPHRVAIALQESGWWVRQDMVWSKTNPTPEPVTSRPTRSHEYVFLLTQSPSYFYDQDAIREPFADARPKLDTRPRQRQIGGRVDGFSRPHGISAKPHKGGRNKRSVWTLPTQPFAQAHFATTPTKLIKPMILAGTSAQGACASCGAPWTRMGDDWKPSCQCGASQTRACTVLDPFSGAASVGVVAIETGRQYIGIDLQADYLPLAKERLRAQRQQDHHKTK